MDQLPEPVLPFLKKTLSLDVPLISVKPAKSAQQTVLILSLPPTVTTNDPVWIHALQHGRHRLVVRIWKGSARWWNLNRNDIQELPRISQDEVKGYGLARRALHDRHERMPYIPQVLHQSESSESCGPWAILEYVGRESALFHDCLFDESWCQSMILERHEFGFDEPHPRWGRVPVNRALEYALLVLHQVTIPMHRYYFDGPNRQQLWESSDDDRDKNATQSAYTFQTMLTLYKSALYEMQTTQCTDAFLQQAISELERGILDLESQAHSITNLPPTLVHMDCQPQNILIATTLDDSHTRIASVLDWEDSAIADPRFELLMLGRKVCANRQQALVIWDTYAEQLPMELGSMDPWLQLETIHSMTTLILQSMNLLNGSRSPWESKPDLMLKIEREITRLSSSTG